MNLGGIDEFSIISLAINQHKFRVPPPDIDHVGIGFSNQSSNFCRSPMLAEVFVGHIVLLVTYKRASLFSSFVFDSCSQTH